MVRRPPRSPPFRCTTLFRSRRSATQSIVRVQGTVIASGCDGRSTSMQAFRVRGHFQQAPAAPAAGRGTGIFGRRVFQYADDVARVPTGFVNAYLLGTATQW